MSFTTLRSAILAVLSIGCAFTTVATAAEPLFQPLQALPIGPGGKKSTLLRAIDKNFYGTSESGGASDLGTVYKVTPEGVITVLHSFNGADGSRPTTALKRTADGYFYGTTYSGGMNDKGTIFRISIDGTFATIHHFTNEGYHPSSFLVGHSDLLYGATEAGENCDGTLFSIAPTSLASDKNYQTLHRFDKNTSGAKPGNFGNTANLIDPLFGTTSEGGAYGYGTFFIWKTDGTFQSLDLQAPHGPLVMGFNDYMYGISGKSQYAPDAQIVRFDWQGNRTVRYTFDSTATQDVPIGNVISTANDILYFNTGNETTKQSTFYRCDNGKDLRTLASYPYTQRSDLSLSGFILPSDRTFYGATETGGVYGSGRVTRMSILGLGGTLADFQYSPKGDYSTAELLEGTDGSFYGTTQDGGFGGKGVVFKLFPDKTLTTLANFDSSNGATPTSGLTSGPDGSIHGTTSGGGSNGEGTLFSISSSGTFATSEIQFATETTGATPLGGILHASDGNDYIPMSRGGSGGRGAILKRTGNTTSILANFDGDNGSEPSAALIQGADGHLYGTTRFGGRFRRGTVFRLTLAGVLTTLVSFDDALTGREPLGRLMQGTDGNFYGTTSTGGTYGDGTVFRITPAGVLTTLVHLKAQTTGARPLGGLTKAPDGNYYGTTSAGATLNAGTLFRITPAGVFQTVHIFGGTAYGAYPSAAPILASDGQLYGITSSGGTMADGQPGGGGQIYRLRPNGSSDEKSLNMLDTDNSGDFVTSEMQAIYPKSADLKKIFPKLDTDKSGAISYKELLAARAKQTAIKTFFTRAAAFQQLDVDDNSYVTTAELYVTYLPGTAGAYQQWGDFTFLTWISAKTLPNLTTWGNAIQARQQRRDFVLRLDVNSDGYISRAEFSKMVSPKTKPAKVEKAWLTATNSLFYPPAQITIAEFIGAPALPALTLY